MDCIATQDKTFPKQLSKPKVRTRRVRLWTRLSPAHLVRVFVDNYVKGCVTFANDSEADARASSFTVTLCDDNGAFTSASHPRHAQGIASAREVNPDLYSKFSHHGSVQGAPVPEQGAVLAGSVHLAHKHHAIITGCHDLTTTDLQGHSSPLNKVGASGLAMVDLQACSDSDTLRVSSPNGFDAVPESKQQPTVLMSPMLVVWRRCFKTPRCTPRSFSNLRRDEGRPSGLTVLAI